MQISRDLLGGSGLPPTLDMRYNGDEDAASTTKRYKGSLVKYMDIDDVDNGAFLTFAGVATAMENVFGILEEEQPTTGNYLPNNATDNEMTKRRITPIFPSSVIRAEYGQADAAGTATYDTNATCTAGSANFTVTITTADYMIGGWVYMINGAAAGELHYILNNSTTVATLATAMTSAVVSADDFLVIQPANDRFVDFDATYTGLKSEIDNGSRTNPIIGIDHFIDAPGIGRTSLDRAKHDGIVVSNARFYHEFVLPNVYLSIGITAA